MVDGAAAARAVVPTANAGGSAVSPGTTATDAAARAVLGEPWRDGTREGSRDGVGEGRASGGGGLINLPNEAAVSAAGRPSATEPSSPDEGGNQRAHQSC